MRRLLFAVPFVCVLTFSVLAACAPAPAPAPISAPAPSTTVKPATPPGSGPSIVFPVSHKVTVTDTFGAARSGGRSHEGLDLFAAKGTPLVAVRDGRVSSVRHSNDGLSGNMVAITADDGWRYLYIHLNNDSPGTDDARNRHDQAFAVGMRPGQRVLAGEPIGFVGDSGNAESTPAHVHFEVRDPNGVPRNPTAALRAARVSVRSAAQIAAAAPRGGLDIVERTAGGSVRVRGWAADRVSSDSVRVSVFVDGNPHSTFLANRRRDSVAIALPGLGVWHGFDENVAVPAGTRQVCVVAHNAGDGGGSVRLGCDVVK